MESNLFSPCIPHHLHHNLLFSTRKPPKPTFGFHYSSKPSSIRPRWRLPKLRFQAKISETNQDRASATGTDKESLPSSVRNPVYTPTPSNRELRTPHSGYTIFSSLLLFCALICLLKNNVVVDLFLKLGYGFYFGRDI